MVILRENVRTLTTVVGGRTPFTTEMWSGKTRPGVSLAQNQVFRTFGVTCYNEPLTPVYYVKPVLPPGETYTLMDSVTGGDMPATVLLGHTLFMFQTWWIVNQKVLIKLYTDGFFHTAAEIDTLTPAYAFSNYLLGSEILDPTGALGPHTLTVTITNLGTKELIGFFGFLGVDTTVGSEPWPQKRTVTCKHCGAKTKVEYSVRKVYCSKCKDAEGKPSLTVYNPMVWGASIG